MKFIWISFLSLFLLTRTLALTEGDTNNGKWLTQGHNQTTSDFVLKEDPNLSKTNSIEKNELINNESSKETFMYDPTGRRDPFLDPWHVESKAMEKKSESREEASTKPKENVNVKIEIDPSNLESYDVNQLKVTAIIWNVRDPKAMIQVPGGKVFIIRQQSRVGKNAGIVKFIREGEVGISEKIENGSWSTKILALKR